MKQVEELFRGEVAAVKSIDTILNRLKNETEVQELRAIREDHIKARDTLRTYLGSDVSSEESKAGPWSTFSSAFTGGASLFGDKAVISALKVGEQHGLNEYEQALKDDSIQPELRQMISSELLPQQRRHMDMINRYLN
jgi:predicted KAP-like P-loop ATPase